jgi:predicted dehydrogenase
MINRREFIGTSAGALAGALVTSSGKAAAVPPSDQVRVGIIGPGSRGSGLMRAFLRVPGVKFSALCDVYEPRLAAARKITGEDTPTFTDYRRLLEAKDLDAVVIATPLSFHASQVTDTLESGRHVYGEKDQAKTVAECDKVVQTVRRTGKLYQVGLQYHYAPWYQEGVRQIRAGKIGQVTQIYAYWHRNNNWRRAVPDPKDVKLERLFNWRMYKEFSGGLLAELGTHHIHLANQVFNDMPESVIGTGGIDYWKDGREVPDNVQVVYRYPGGRTLFFSAITTNRLEGAQIRVYGTGGTIVFTQADGMSYYEPAQGANSAVPQELVVERGVTTTASFRAEKPYGGQGTPLPVSDDVRGNADYLACASFVDCVRNNKQPGANEMWGWISGVAVALGNQAIESGQRVVFAEHAKKPA